MLLKGGAFPGCGPSSVLTFVHLIQVSSFLNIDAAFHSLSFSMLYVVVICLVHPASYGLYTCSLEITACVISRAE